MTFALKFIWVSYFVFALFLQINVNVVIADESVGLNGSIIPRPAKMLIHNSKIEISSASRIVVDFFYKSDPDPEILRMGNLLSGYIKESCGINCPVMQIPDDWVRKNDIRLSRDRRGTGDESYNIECPPDFIWLTGGSEEGLFHGIQTLRQMFSNVQSVGPARVFIPCVDIIDQPRFRHRGMLLDCGRHFMSKDFIKRYIDLMAYHKMNVLHWHLTEDQGWRIEIKKYPQLTEVGTWRKATRDSEQPRDTRGRYGGFYTQDDIREIVAYARARYITIIPEIEMPGHSLAALAARPDLSCTGGPLEVGTEWGVIDDVYCAGNEQTFEFLQDVLTEVMALFPGEYIHIGGDECPKARWKTCAKCQKRMHDEGLKNEHELQSYFIRRIEKFLNANGRRLIGWDEILEGGLAPNATVQAWRGMDAAATAARSGHDVIVSPTSHCYLDYPQFVPDGDVTSAFAIDRVFAFDPMPKGLDAAHQRHILGLEGNIWTERAPQNLVDNRVFPRLCALAEIAWSPAEPHDWNEFRGRLRTHLKRLDALGVKYFIDPPRFASGETAFTGSTDVKLESPVMEGRIVYTLDGSEPNDRSPKIAGALHLSDTTTIRSRLIFDDGRMSEVVSRLFRKIVTREPDDTDLPTPRSSPTTGRPKP